MKILLCGDIMLGENLFHRGRGIINKYKGNYAALLSQQVFEELTQESDSLMFNCEFSLFQNPISSYKNTDEKVYRGEIESLELFRKFKGVKIANVANNHFSQHGQVSARFTCDTIQGNGMKLVGKNQNPCLLNDFDGKVIKIWGVSLIEDPFYCDFYWQSNPVELIEIFRKQSKSENEFWIVTIHWGDEYIAQPSPVQIDLAHKLIDSGIDLIVGHHPHVIQSIEVYKNKTVFYSFGNFIFDQNFSEETTSGLAAIFDTTSNSLIKLFKTRQKAYAVNSIREVSPDEYSLKVDFKYIDELAKNQAGFRKKMKAEYIRNFYKTSPEVFVYVIKKMLK